MKPQRHEPSWRVTPDLLNFHIKARPCVARRMLSRHVARDGGVAAQAEAPCALGRRKCSSSRGMISTKLQGRVR